MWLLSLGLLAVLLVLVGDAITRHLDALLAQGERHMATLQEVRDSIAALNSEVISTIEAEGAQVNTRIQELIDQIANGGVVTAADLDSLKADLDTARVNFVTRVGSIYEPPVVEPPVEG